MTDPEYLALRKAEAAAWDEYKAVEAAALKKWARLYHVVEEENERRMREKIRQEIQESTQENKP